MNQLLPVRTRPPLRNVGDFASINKPLPSASQQTYSPYHPFFAIDGFRRPSDPGEWTSGANLPGIPPNPAAWQTGPVDFGQNADFESSRGGPGIDIWNPPPGGYSLYTLQPNPAPSYGIVKGLVVGTTFSGPHDVVRSTGKPNVSAYTGATVDPNALGVSLPYGFPQPHPGQLPGVLFRIRSLSTGRSVVAPLVDRGPHETGNPFWKAPPPSNGVYTYPKGNHSRLDMTPATARALGLRVKESLSQGPMLDTPNKDEIFYIEEAYPLFNDRYENHTYSPAVHGHGGLPRRRNPNHR
jgi:hypothetical protein